MPVIGMISDPGMGDAPTAPAEIEAPMIHPLAVADFSLMLLAKRMSLDFFFKHLQNAAPQPVDVLARP